MVDLPYGTKFDSLPNVDIEQIVEYFNLEFGLNDDTADNKFTEDDFHYMGVFQVGEIETVFWSVKGQNVCATVQPYENSYILGMDSCPSQTNKG